MTGNSPCLRIPRPYAARFYGAGAFENDMSRDRAVRTVLQVLEKVYTIQYIPEGPHSQPVLDRRA